MNNFERIYKELKDKHGGFPGDQWSLWCKRPKSDHEREEVIIGAILTQRTNWRNVELAIANLKKARVSSLKSVWRLNEEKLRRLIKPSGFYKTKAGYLTALVDFIFKNYGSVARMKRAELTLLRGQLLSLKGVGPETADSILLYALDKPVFVIDEYTKRFVLRLKLAEAKQCQFLQELFEENLKKDFRLYQDFHALIVMDGKNKMSCNID